MFEKLWINVKKSLDNIVVREDVFEGNISVLCANQRGAKDDGEVVRRHAVAVRVLHYFEKVVEEGFERISGGIIQLGDQLTELRNQRVVVIDKCRNLTPPSVLLIRPRFD